MICLNQNCVITIDFNCQKGEKIQKGFDFANNIRNNESDLFNKI